MIDFDAWKFCSIYAAIVIVLIPISTVSAKIDARMDIVVILQRDHTIGERNEMAAYRTFGTFFEFGEEKTRFAIMFYMDSVPKGPPEVPYYTDINPVIMNFSGDSELYDQKMVDYQMPVDWGLDGGSWHVKDRDNTLNLVGQKMFPDFRPANRARILFYIVTEPASDELDLFENYSMVLRDSGVLIYMFVRNGEEKDLEAARLATSRNRIFVWKDRQYDQSLVDEMVKVKDAILRDLCRWDTMCRFQTEGENCKLEVIEPMRNLYMANYDEQCGAVEETSTDQCSHNDCLQECDKRWPWDTKPTCDGNCGVEVNGTREGNHPPYMENCPTWIVCPPCLAVISTTETAENSADSIVDSTDLVVNVNNCLPVDTDGGGDQGLVHIPDGDLPPTNPTADLPTGAIVGLVVGIGALLVAAIFALMFVIRKRARMESMVTGSSVRRPASSSASSVKSADKTVLSNTASTGDGDARSGKESSAASIARIGTSRAEGRSLTGISNASSATMALSRLRDDRSGRSTERVSFGKLKGSR